MTFRAGHRPWTGGLAGIPLRLHGSSGRHEPWRWKQQNYPICLTRLTDDALTPSRRIIVKMLTHRLYYRLKAKKSRFKINRVAFLIIFYDLPAKMDFGTSVLNPLFHNPARLYHRWHCSVTAGLFFHCLPDPHFFRNFHFKYVLLRKGFVFLWFFVSLFPTPHANIFVLRNIMSHKDEDLFVNSQLIFIKSSMNPINPVILRASLLARRSLPYLSINLLLKTSSYRFDRRGDLRRHHCPPSGNRLVLHQLYR